jgi:transcriptional regulator with GAF, ATPase, and Fis domain
MTDQTPHPSNELQENFAQVMEEFQQLETVLSRLFQILTQNGFQISVDVAGMTRSIQQRLEKAQHQGKNIAEQIGQLQELMRTFALMTSSLRLEQVLEEVMDTVIKLTGAERAYLMLREKQSDELRIRAARNWDRETITDTESSFSSSIINSAMEQKIPILTTNAQDDTRFQSAQSVMSNKLRSILCIPLILRGESVGVLYTDNRLSQDIFKQDKIPLLTAFGTQAAIAIENARLFGQVKADLDKALTELQTLQIQIDQSKVDEQVQDITESDYFRNLKSQAQNMRRSGQSE